MSNAVNKQDYIYRLKFLKGCASTCKVKVTETDNGYVLTGPDKIYLGVYEHNAMSGIDVALPEDITRYIIEPHELSDTCKINVAIIFTTGTNKTSAVNIFEDKSECIVNCRLSEIERMPEAYFAEDLSLTKAPKSASFLLLVSNLEEIASEGEIAFAFAFTDTTNNTIEKYYTNSIPYVMDEVAINDKAGVGEV